MVTTPHAPGASVDGLARLSDSPTLLAERRLAHRIRVATAIGIPVGATVMALLVAVAMIIAGKPAIVPAEAGAGVGVLAGAFFGMWTGFVASANELDHLDIDDAKP